MSMQYGFTSKHDLQPHMCFYYGLCSCSADGQSTLESASAYTQNWQTTWDKFNFMHKESSCLKISFQTFLTKWITTLRLKTRKRSKNNACLLESSLFINKNCCWLLKMSGIGNSSDEGWKMSTVRSAPPNLGHCSIKYATFSSPARKRPSIPIMRSPSISQMTAAPSVHSLQSGVGCTTSQTWFPIMSGCSESGASESHRQGHKKENHVPLQVTYKTKRTTTGLFKKRTTIIDHGTFRRHR